MNDKDDRTDRSYLPRSYGSGSKPEEKAAPEDGPELDTNYLDDDSDASVIGAVVTAEPDAFDQEKLEEEEVSESCPAERAAALRDPVERREPALRQEPLKVNVNVVGVRFEYAGRIYNFDAGDMELSVADSVIVKTEKGMGLAQIAVAPREMQIDASHAEVLRKVIRKAGKVDFDQAARCRAREAEAHRYCLEKVAELGLAMKLVGVECHFDGSKYVFYFTAEGRVDFRELVRQLVVRFPVRIEMRQIGVRHEAKMIGGLAACGQELCCSRFLTEFRPVSVKMAKKQNLSLNPSKISGSCGRLMCCLAYEHEIYEEFKKGLPKPGKTVNTTKGQGVLIKHNPLEETVTIQIDETRTVDVRKEDIIGELDPVQSKNDKKGRK